MHAPVAPQTIGSNKPPLTTTTELSADFAYLERAISAIEPLYREAPSVVEDDEDIGVLREIVKLCMAESKHAEALRVDTKEPYLTAGRVVDDYFSQLKAKVAKWQADLEARAKIYLDKKAAAERARREEEARRAQAEARRLAEEAAAAQAAAAQAQRETALKAQQDAAAAREAEDRAREASVAAQAATTAAASATEAQRAAEAKPADMARTRAGGGLSTLSAKWVFEITDFDKIDLEALRPFITKVDLEKALRRFVDVNKDSKPLAGVRIYADTNVSFR